MIEEGVTGEGVAQHRYLDQDCEEQVVSTTRKEGEELAGWLARHQQDIADAWANNPPKEDE